MEIILSTGRQMTINEDKPYMSAVCSVEGEPELSKLEMIEATLKVHQLLKDGTIKGRLVPDSWLTLSFGI